MEIARVLVSGDDHLCSKNRGCHNNYPDESLNYFNFVTDIAKNYGCTHIIGAGDFTYGRFGTLEYRDRVEQALKKRNEIVNGNYYMIRGNHDIATYGMTEYEFYLNKKMFKGPERLVLGNVNINMLNFGDYNKQDIVIEPNASNILVTHGYFKFKDTNLPNYGTAVELDEMAGWFGLDYIICGHIHNEHMFKGAIVKENMGKEVQVHYLPCLSRPDYTEDIATKGSVVILRVFDDAPVDYNRIEVDLLPIEQSFNLAVKEKEVEHKKAVSVDVSDVVKTLDGFERAVGNPEDIIASKTDIDEKYRKKAIELLKSAYA